MIEQDDEIGTGGKSHEWNDGMDTRVFFIEEGTKNFGVEFGISHKKKKGFVPLTNFE